MKAPKAFMRLLITTCLALFTVFAFAQKSETSRILIHTLNYLGGDYKHAVKDGKVIDAGEYEEQVEFCEDAEKYFKEFSAEWSDEDSVAVGKMVYELTGLIRAKGSPELAVKKSAEIRTRILAITGLKTYPTRYPDIAAGKKIFAVECAKCHGQQGYGDGPEGKALEPKPRNFHDAERMNEIAPAHVFNTVRLGVEGTGMKPLPHIEDKDVWNVAFYVLTLRYPEKSKTELSEKLQALTLEDIATNSDGELQEKFALTNDDLATLRYAQRKPQNDRFLKTAFDYLNETEQAYTDAKARDALKLASLAYLEGIEPIELQLRASDPELSDRLEKQFLQISKMIRQNRPVEEVSDSINEAKITITEVSKVLEKKEYSFWMALMMSLSILLREGLEAFLVILVMLTILKAGNIPAARWVHLGWVSAIVAGLALWALSGKIITEGIANLALLEGIISLIAVAMLLYVGFWLHGKSEIDKWKAYVNQMVKGAIDKGSGWGLASLAFFVVFREVFESVLFLSALNIESGGKQSHAIAFGVGIAFVLVVAIALIILQFSTKLPIPKFFKISSVVMGLLAVILAGKGVHSLQEINCVPVHGLPFSRIEQLGLYPTVETVATQIFVLLLVIGVYVRKGKG